MPVRVIHMGNGQVEMSGTRIPDTIQDTCQEKADNNRKQEGVFKTIIYYFEF